MMDRVLIVLVILFVFVNCTQQKEKTQISTDYIFNLCVDDYDVSFDTLTPNNFEFDLFNENEMKPPYGTIKINETDSLLEVVCEVKQNGIQCFYRSSFSFWIPKKDTIKLQNIFDEFTYNYTTVYPSEQDFMTKYNFEVEQKYSSIIINDFDLNTSYQIEFNYHIQNIHPENLIGVVLNLEGDNNSMYVFDKNRDTWFLKQYYDLNDSLIVNRTVLRSDTVNFFQTKNDFHRLDWINRCSRGNDSTIKNVKELLEFRYDEEYPDFGLLDFNQDGYKDLVFDYYASCGTGVKFRVDVYFYNPKTQKFDKEDFSVMNPYYDYESKILTSHYYGHGGGWAVKYKLEKGIFKEIERYSIDIRPNGIESDKLVVNYLWSKCPFTDTLQWVEQNYFVELPEEYHYEKIV